MQALESRRAAHSWERPVFPTPSGLPDGHLLWRLKKAAHATGLNCGPCTNRAGQKCCEGPVCGKWQLHSFRRTVATRWHEAGLSVSTVQRLLGHSDIQTTMAYLGSQDLQGAELRAGINGSFEQMWAS